MMAISILLTCLGCFAFSLVRSIPLLALADGLADVQHVGFDRCHVLC
jgi:hypothetical protein